MIVGESFSVKYNTPLESTQRGLESIGVGRVVLVAISGKICSGKDTVAALVTDKVSGSGGNVFATVSFADALKSEIDDIIGIIKVYTKSCDYISQGLVEEVASVMFCSESDSRSVCKMLFDDVRSGAVVSSRNKTLGLRDSLQFWGSQVRRKQDVSYWVKKTALRVLDLIEQGFSVVISDVRFPNEAELVIDLGGLLVRLQVSSEVQDERVFLRDGVKMSLEAKTHESEISLDSYKKFSVIIDTDLIDANEVSEIIFNSMFDSGLV